MTQPYGYGVGTFSPKLQEYSIARKQVSQNGSGYVGIQIVDTKGDLHDATDIEMTLYHDGDFDETNAAPDESPHGVVVATYTASQITRESIGVYSVEIGPKITQERGNLTAVWTYEVEGNALGFTDYLQVTEYMPTYDRLRDHEKAAVEEVAWMFADLFDSTNGGPNLNEQFQSHWGYERFAQLMGFAVRRINTQGVPLTRFGIGEGTTRMPANFDSFLVLGTYLEAMLHLMRSYVEQPEFRNMAVTYTDRRDYLTRWKVIYDDEKRSYDANLKLAKRSLLGLGRGALLVAGGIYGGGSNYFRSGTYAAQTRSMRFYPAAPAVFLSR